MDRWLSEWFSEYGGRTIGVILGLLLALFILEYGLLRAIFTLIVVVLGWFIGLRIDEAGGLLEFAQRFGRRD